MAETITPRPTTLSAVELDGDFAPEHILALSKATPKSECDDARKALPVGVYAVDLNVNIKGDIEVGEKTLRRETLDLEPILLAALAKLTSPEREKVYKNTALPASTAAILGGELEALRVGLPRHFAAGKLTAHLKVTEGHPSFSA